MEGKVEIGAAANIVGDVMRKAIADEFKSQAVALRIALLTDAESASYAAEDAVKKALKMQGKDTHWKHRMEGVFIGVAVVLLGARLYGWFGK